MKITKLGKYKLLEDRRYSAPYMSFGLSAGTVIDVTQIDATNRKFYATILSDWQYYEQPFEFISDLN